jgi:hypothetical protein
LLSGDEKEQSVANAQMRLGLSVLASVCTLSLSCEMRPAFAVEAEAGSPSQRAVVQKRTADANALVSSEAPRASRRLAGASAKGPYYVDFRARTAASWGHAFVWYGKTSERQVEVAGLTPAGDTTEYVLGYFTWVPSETGASYGDLDPQYLTASYRVYLNEADAKRVFAYIKKLQASSPVWNAETANCTGFIGNIAEFMGLKTPSRWTRPEDYVNKLKEINGGRRMVELTSEQ